MTVWAGPAEDSSISTAIRLLGDRWSLLIVRELLVGNSRFSHILEALPGLSRGLLATRLGYLTRLGIVVRRATDGTDLRAKHCYVLTEAGSALEPVLDALGAWATAWPGPARLVPEEPEQMDLDQLRLRLDPAALPMERMQIQFDLLSSSPAWLRVDGSRIQASHGSAELSSDLVVRSSMATLDDLYWRRLTCREAIARRDISFEGPQSYAETFASWFPAQRPSAGHSS